MPYGIYLPGRWRSQPQGAVEVDWGHPLARGLRAFAMAGRAVLVGLEVYERGNRYNTSLTNNPNSWGNIQRAIHPRYGLGHSNSATTGGLEIALADPPTLGGDVAASVTALLIGRPSTTTAAGLNHVAFQNATGNGLAVETVGTVAGRLRTRAFVNSDQRYSGTYDAPTDREVTVAGQHIANVGQRLWVNAELVASQTTFTGNPSLGFAYLFGVNSAVGATNYTGALWGRDVSGAEQAAFSDNPWQLLRPRRPIIYSLPSSTPVLSAATVIDIGSTSVRPRVTITI